MSQNTPFSFHCMICFEEFNPDDRYPVVLPCGHTYVCIVCANRLDKCMECRTPLFTILSTPSRPTHNLAATNAPPSSGASWSRPSTRYSASIVPPAPAPIKKKLPLPKNVVLLSLIEATEMASENALKKYGESPMRVRNSLNLDGATSIPLLHSMGSMMDAIEEEVEEEERIRISTTIAVGVAGTYAVAAKDGLEILSSRPSDSRSSAIDARDEDVDSLVKFYNIDTIDECEDTPNSRKSKDPLRLCFGDRVQIVAFEGGLAKLARGYGFVKADNNQLVKVGGSVDRACSLEAMLRSLSDKRKELRIDQSKVDNQFIRYMNDLQHSLQNDEDLTVILADTFSPPAEMIHIQDEVKEERSSSVANEEENDDSSIVSKISPPGRSLTPPLQGSRVSRFTCFSAGVFDDDDTGQNEGRALFSHASHPSPRAMRAGAQAWRDRQGRPHGSDWGVDFRTGMSGHTALLSSHSNSHKYLEPTYRPPTASRMSSHSGLGMTLPSLNDLLNSFTLPVMSSSQDMPRREGIRHNGSM